MIALKSNDSGSSFHVCEDGEPIGYIRMHKGLTGMKYLAMVKHNGEEHSSDKEFDSPQDALQWIERHISDLMTFP